MITSKLLHSVLKENQTDNPPEEFSQRTQKIVDVCKETPLCKKLYEEILQTGLENFINPIGVIQVAVTIGIDIGLQIAKKEQEELCQTKNQIN